jgi:general secretion pathway protein A
MSLEPHLEHFGLREPPFLLAPDPDFLYLSTQHSLAQAYLSYTLLNRDSSVVLTGETGTGKTTLINRLIETAGEEVAVALVAHTQLTPVELLQSILLGFGIRAFDKQKVELFATLEDYIGEQQQAGRQVLVAVDDAHNLGVDVLEEIRLVSQLGTRKDAAVNLILSGRPTLNDTLSLPLLEQLRQRMRFSFELAPLSADETAEYIARRLEVAGAEQPLFAPECIPMVVRYTAGIPRLINILCDTALMSAFTDGAAHVNVALMQSAVAELDWLPQTSTGMTEEGFDNLPPDDVDLPDLASPVPPTLLHAGEVAARPAGPDGGPRAVLTLFVDGEEQARHVLSGDRLTIGRERDNDIQISAEYVSRHHAQVSWLRGGCWIADLNSTNGTFVNGLRVRRRLLRQGDEIQFGRHLLRVSCMTPSAEAQAADAEDDWQKTLLLTGDGNTAVFD